MSISDYIARWKLDELIGTLAKDSGPNGYDGIYVNNPTLGVDGAFGTSKAVTFASASNQYVAGAALSLTSDWTVGFWSKHSSLVALQYPIGLASGGVGVFFNPGLAIGFYDGSTLLNSSVIPRTNTWYNVVVTKSGTTYKIYVNGIGVGSGTKGDVDVTRVNIGGRGVGDCICDATIDDVRIYSRALSSEEVLDLYTFYLAYTTQPNSTIFLPNLENHKIEKTLGTVTSNNRSYIFGNNGSLDIENIETKFNNTLGQSFSL